MATIDPFLKSGSLNNSQAIYLTQNKLEQVQHALEQALAAYKAGSDFEVVIPLVEVALNELKRTRKIMSNKGMNPNNQLSDNYPH